MTLPKNLEVARRAKLEPLSEIGAEIGIGEHLLEPYGEGVAKIKLEAIEELAGRPKAKYVVVSGMTPTPLGEGKTATVTVRQASMGPVFGIKGGAAGGGYSQIVPMEALNLHLTGDTHAVTEANNQLAAMIDDHLYQGNALGIEPHSITWRRVIDVIDRALRHIVVGLGARTDGVPRQSGFDITAASEVMAILALSTSLRDMRSRLGRIVIGADAYGNPVTAEDLKAAGVMTVIMKEALKPNLMQT